MKLEITPGEVGINSVTATRKGCVCIVRIDTFTKYPRLNAASGQGVHLVADQFSLKKVEERAGKITSVSVVDLPDGWNLVGVETGRYYVNFVLVHQEQFEASSDESVETLVCG